MQHSPVPRHAAGRAGGLHLPACSARCCGRCDAGSGLSPAQSRPPLRRSEPPERPPAAPTLPRGFPRNSPPRRDLAQVRVQLTSGYYDSLVGSPPSAASGAAPALRRPRLASARPRRDPGSPPRRYAALLRPRHCGFAYGSRLFLSSLVACWDPQLSCQIARDVPVCPRRPGIGGGCCPSAKPPSALAYFTVAAVVLVLAGSVWQVPGAQLSLGGQRTPARPFAAAVWSASPLVESCCPSGAGEPPPLAPSGSAGPAKAAEVCPTS